MYFHRPLSVHVVVMTFGIPPSVPHFFFFSRVHCYHRTASMPYRPLPSRLIARCRLLRSTARAPLPFHRHHRLPPVAVVWFLLPVSRRRATNADAASRRQNALRGSRTCLTWSPVWTPPKQRGGRRNVVLGWIRYRRSNLCHVLRRTFSRSCAIRLPTAAPVRLRLVAFAVGSTVGLLFAVVKTRVTTCTREHYTFSSHRLRLPRITFTATITWTPHVHHRRTAFTGSTYRSATTPRGLPHFFLRRLPCPSTHLPVPWFYWFCPLGLPGLISSTYLTTLLVLAVGCACRRNAVTLR